MATARYFIGVLLMVTMPPAIVWWYVVHPFIGFWRRLGVRRTMITVAVLMIGVLAALVPARDVLLGRDLGTRWPLVGLAALLTATGVALTLWRRRHLTQRMLSGINELEGDARTLLTQGPYGIIRHPRYVEVTVFTFAYAAFANYVGSWILAALTFPALHVVVLFEERELAERFGPAWAEYRAKVPRWLPRLR
jgi:protein-S-isoprenylcysteine O-methyltransferase Ste14